MCDNHPEFVTHWLRALPAKFQFIDDFLRQLFLRQCDQPGAVLHGGENFLQQIRHFQPQRRCVDAGMAAA